MLHLSPATRAYCYGPAECPTSFITCLTKVITDTRDCGVPKIRLILLLCKKNRNIVDVKYLAGDSIPFLKNQLSEFHKLITTIEMMGYIILILKRKAVMAEAKEVMLSLSFDTFSDSVKAFDD